MGPRTRFPQGLLPFTAPQTIFPFAIRTKHRKLGSLDPKLFGISLFNIPLIPKAESGSESIPTATKKDLLQNKERYEEVFYLEECRFVGLGRACSVTRHNV